MPEEQENGPERQKPKIHVDEDWKTQASSEKEILEQQREAERQAKAAEAGSEEAGPPPGGGQPPGGGEPSAAEASAAEQAAAGAASGESGPGADLPPASFSTLVSMLATQAMLCLGQIPHPASGQPELDLPQARHFVDLLGVLEEKTQGNLAEEEATALNTMLHQLRMACVSISQQAQQPGGQGGGK